MNRRLALSIVTALCLGTLGAACEKTSHENIDKWARTEKGPGKLLGALKSSENAPDLRAHAAAVIIEDGRFTDIREVLEGIEDEARHKIIADLATRLWELARINKELDIPSASQIRAKDALFYTLEMGDSATRAKIADYLVEWFVGGHYEGRARSGAVSGALAIRNIGEPASGPLLNRARGIIARPPSPDGKRDAIGDELLKALALSGTTESIEFLMDLVEHPRQDKTLPGRAVSAMHFAYAEPLGMDPLPGETVAVIAERIEAMFYKQSMSGTIRNDAVALLATLEPSKCIPVFTRMIQYPSEQARFRWIGARHGLECGGEQGIEAIVGALPPTVSYERGMLSKYLWDKILQLPDKKKIASAAAALLESESWVSRVTGVEVLGLLGKEGDVPENIKLIGGLSGDSAVLKNWWGKQEDVPKAKQKPTPTLGQVASDVAKSLETLALGAKGK
jgi:hypothetical protein